MVISLPRRCTLARYAYRKQQHKNQTHTRQCTFLHFIKAIRRDSKYDFLGIPDIVFDVIFIIINCLSWKSKSWIAHFNFSIDIPISFCSFLSNVSNNFSRLTQSQNGKCKYTKLLLMQLKSLPVRSNNKYQYQPPFPSSSSERMIRNVLGIQLHAREIWHANSFSCWSMFDRQEKGVFIHFLGCISFDKADPCVIFGNDVVGAIEVVAPNNPLLLAYGTKLENIPNYVDGYWAYCVFPAPYPPKLPNVKLSTLPMKADLVCCWP